MPWVISARSNNSDNFFNFDWLWDSFFLRHEYYGTVTLDLFSQGSEERRSQGTARSQVLQDLLFLNLWSHWAFQTSETYTVLKDSKFPYILWKLIAGDGLKLVLPLRKSQLQFSQLANHHGYNEQAIGTRLFQQRHMLPHSQPNWQKTWEGAGRSTWALRMGRTKECLKQKYF